jgi:hypothetical protein
LQETSKTWLHKRKAEAKEVAKSPIENSGNPPNTEAPTPCVAVDGGLSIEMKTGKTPPSRNR